MHRRALTAVLVTAALAVPLAASAADYPPTSSGQGTANPSRVKQGQCTNFAGDGFAADAALVLADDGVAYGPATADKKGRFRERICFANDAKVGDHTLTADGQDAASGSRRVSATVTVTGVEQTAASSGTGAAAPSSTSGLAVTRAATGTQDLRDAQSAAQTTTASSARPRSFFGVEAGEVVIAAGWVLLLAIPVLCSVVLIAERRYRRRRGERVAAA